MMITWNMMMMNKKNVESFNVLFMSSFWGFLLPFLILLIIIVIMSLELSLTRVLILQKTRQASSFEEKEGRRTSLRISGETRDERRTTFRIFNDHLVSWGFVILCLFYCLPLESEQSSDVWFFPLILLIWCFRKRNSQNSFCCIIWHLSVHYSLSPPFNLMWIHAIWYSYDL